MKVLYVEIATMLQQLRKGLAASKHTLRKHTLQVTSSITQRVEGIL